MGDGAVGFFWFDSAIRPTANKPIRGSIQILRALQARWIAWHDIGVDEGAIHAARFGHRKQASKLLRLRCLIAHDPVAQAAWLGPALDSRPSQAARVGRATVRRAAE